MESTILSSNDLVLVVAMMPDGVRRLAFDPGPEKDYFLEVFWNEHYVAAYNYYAKHGYPVPSPSQCFAMSDSKLPKKLFQVCKPEAKKTTRREGAS